MGPSGNEGAERPEEYQVTAMAPSVYEDRYKQP